MRKKKGLSAFISSDPEETLKTLMSKRAIKIAIVISVIFIFITGPGFILVPIFYILMIFGLKEIVKHRNFMKQFALENGLKFKKKINPKKLTGRLFKIGNSRQASNVIYGKYNNLPVQIFNYQYTVGSGKNSHTYRFTICEITIKDISFPHIFLKSDSMSRYHTMDLFGLNKDIRIRLEGDLERYFNLYCTQDYEIETLQIFTIDFLNLLKERASYLSIEFSEDKIYIYDDLTIKKKDQLTRFYSVVKSFIDKKGQLLQRLRDDFDAMHQSYRK